MAFGYRANLKSFFPNNLKIPRKFLDLLKLKFWNEPQYSPDSKYHKGWFFPKFYSRKILTYKICAENAPRLRKKFSSSEKKLQLLKASSKHNVRLIFHFHYPLLSLAQIPQKIICPRHTASLLLVEKSSSKINYRLPK